MPTLSFHPFSDFIAITGGKKCGKTHFTKNLAHNLNRAFVVDPTWQLSELGYCIHYPDRILSTFTKFKKVVYQPKSQAPEAYRAVYQNILKFSNFTLIIDEVHSQASAKSYVCPELKDIVVAGRAQGIGLAVNTRRPSDIHKDIRSQADHVIVFRTVEPSDLAYVSEWIGIGELEIKQLSNFWHYYYNTETHETTLSQPI